MLTVIFAVALPLAVNGQREAVLSAGGSDSGHTSCVHIGTYDDKQRERIFGQIPPYGIRYTKAHPLIIALDWAFPPYSYVNEAGYPEGMLVDVLNEIFDRFRVAHEIRMMSHEESWKQLREGTVHVVIDVNNAPLTQDGIKCGHADLAPYNVMAIHLSETPMMRSLMFFGRGDTLLVNNDNYSNYYLVNAFKDSIRFAIRGVNHNKAINDIIEGRAKYFVWDEMALRVLVRKYDIENIVAMDPVDIPSGTLRFYCADTLLLGEFDYILNHLKNTNLYQPIYQKWFGQNKKDSKSLSVQVLFFALVVIVAIILLVMILRSTSDKLQTEFAAISKFGVDISHCQLVVIDVRKQWVYNKAGDFLPPGGIPYKEYLDLIHPDDRHVVTGAKTDVDGGRHDMPTIHFRMRRHDDETLEWRNMEVNAIIKTKKGKPQYLYLALSDTTEHQKDSIRLGKTVKEYGCIMDMSDVGRAYFDRSGHMQRYNKAFVTFFDKGGLDKADAFLQDKNLRALLIMFNGMILEENMDVWFGAPIDIPELQLKGTVEIRLRTVWDDSQCCAGYIMTLYDKEVIYDVTQSNRVLDMDMNALRNTLDELQMEMKFVMQRNKMSVFKWKVNSDTLLLSDGNLHESEIKYQDYVDMLSESDRNGILAALRSPQKYIRQPMHVVRQLKGLNDENDLRWYDTYLTPDYDINGTYIGVFGIRCDITEFMVTQNKLREETEKALDSGRQKALFLQSMTHELRTPLNAINGFAEILSFLTTDEEKKEYINIMAHNCTMLISLIDNILQISTIDTDGLILKKKRVDFAKAFKESAENLQKYIANPEVAYRIDTPMDSLILEIDEERVLQILDIFVNNASKFTKEGFIHVGFRYSGNMLTVYCRDTGCGIPQDKQQEVFNRFTKLDEFVAGAGLGLPLAKSIADIMGATIDLYSNENEGTVVSLTLDTSPTFTPPVKVNRDWIGNEL